MPLLGTFGQPLCLCELVASSIVEDAVAEFLTKKKMAND